MQNLFQHPIGRCIPTGCINGPEFISGPFILIYADNIGLTAINRF
jgi:hypothetical protein